MKKRKNEDFFLQSKGFSLHFCGSFQSTRNQYFACVCTEPTLLEENHRIFKKCDCLVQNGAQKLKYF